MAPIGSYGHQYDFDNTSNIVDLIKLKKNQFAKINPFNIVSSKASKEVIGNALFQEISKIDTETCIAGEESSFFVCDLGEVVRLVNNWRLNLPRVEPFYAVKCNNDPELLKILNEFNLGFDCASQNEIDMVLKMGVNPNKIIYANPCKTSSFIRHANNNKINLTTVDNKEELIKISKFHPNTGILLRISTDDTTATCPLSTKFGATVDECKELINLSHELNLNIKGVAFHVGSGAKDFKAIELAVKDSRSLFDYAKNETGYYNMSILDIGGGFSLESFEQSSKAVNYSLDTYFNEIEFPDLKIMAEPGRYLSASAFTLACNIIAKRENKDGTSRIYINDGVYGNLNCIIYDHQICEPKVLSLGNNFKFFENINGNNNNNKLSSASVWGPTCDALDCISNDTKLPTDLKVGDWLYFNNVGSYTSAAATSFNGFKQTANVKYVFSE